MKKLILAIFAMILLTGCEQNYQKAEPSNRAGRNIEIDTISIHGNKHEVLFWSGKHKGGMTHSPECWCKKGEKE